MHDKHHTVQAANCPKLSYLATQQVDTLNPDLHAANHGVASCLLSQIARDDTRNANNMSPDTPQWLHLEHRMSVHLVKHGETRRGIVETVNENKINNIK